MSELSTKYTPSEIEEKWYSHWEKSGYFHNEPDEREPFSIVIPPPNVTGVLHMGHMLNNTIQDALTRKARLEGKNAIWIPGTDHASIATEAKVVRMLRERGIKKSDLTREEFMAYAWEWKEKYGGIILQQLRKLGSSCDWERTAFTMDDNYSADVIHTFVDLYRKGKLYRDYRMVNWDCEAKTVLSNEEVIHGEEQAQLFHVKYFVQRTGDSQKETGADDFVIIATQRPETIMADAAVAVHPNDPRYAHLKGKKVLVPLVNRAIPIIFDEYVDIDFGTGALKVTPAHDPNDYELGKKHGLEVIDLLNDDGTLNEKCGVASLVGVDRFEARRHTKNLLTQSGNLVKLEDYKTNIGRSERTNTVVEPKMSLQWYVNMKAIAEPALQAVETDDIDFYPKSFKNTYRYWMDNIRDWCISRQLWWGHRIPAWYLVPSAPKGGTDTSITPHLGVGGQEIFVAETAEEALTLAQAKYPSVSAADLKQDEDVLDTWASSWLWPISTLNGFKNAKEFDYYYPTSVLVTGWDIIFLWVARMAMAGFEWKQQRPFKAVYFTGMVRDKQRRKMSKSLGNSPDALQLIEDFGADGVRFGMLASSPAGGDLLFDEKLCEQGRNFCNKMWNALRLVKGWEVEQGYHSEVESLSAAWFEAKMSLILVEIEDNFKQYRLSEALMGLYNFIWDDYCSWYLEMIKPEYGKPIDRETLQKTEVIFRKLMAMLHPFMPFITEEIWQQLDGKAKEGADLCVAKYPKATDFDAELVKKVEAAKDIISKIREIRNNKGLKQREPLVVKFQASETVKELMDTEGVRNLIKKLGVLESLQTTEGDVENAVSFVSGTDKFYVVLNQEINVEEEREKITKELTYQQGFLKSIDIKLSNERFVANAKPEIVANEQQKKADALARIKILEESLAGL
jgi:valyl-tRNA synthetase